MKLIDLDPHFVGRGGEGVTDKDGQPVPRREGVGISLDCPCGCEFPLFVPFVNPLDGGAPTHPEGAQWQREGETFETLTLKPSILRAKAKGGCGWHSFVTNGNVTGQLE